MATKAEVYKQLARFKTHNYVFVEIGKHIYVVLSAPYKGMTKNARNDYAKTKFITKVKYE